MPSAPTERAKARRANPVGASGRGSGRGATPARSARLEVRLPAPSTAGGMPLAEAMHRRRSERSFAARPLGDELLGQLLWSAQGITGEQGYRATPSAGAIFPLTVLLVDPDGVYEYTPEKHALRRVLAGDIRSRLQAASLDQSCVGSAPANLVIAMQVAPMAAKYGAQAERYCLLEAGHAAQNVLLQATGLGLVAVPVAAFQEEEVAALLDLPRNLVPVYMLPLGWPA